MYVADRRGRHRAVPHPLGPARARRRRAPEGRRHGRHQGATRTRYRNVILAGAIAGLGGAFFTIGSVGAFSKNMTSGQGFIALAAVIFGRWSPRGAVAAALLFGFADATCRRAVDHRARRSRPSSCAMLPVRRHDLRRRRARRQGAGAGRRRRAVRQGVTARAARPIDWDALRAAAVEAMQHAYAPYSRVPGGAAALVDDGRVVVGLQRRERVVRRDAVRRVRRWSAPARRPAAAGCVAFTCVDGHGNVLMPCGRCRQLLWEHGGAELLLRPRSGVRR